MMFSQGCRETAIRGHDKPASCCIIGIVSWSDHDYIKHVLTLSLVSLDTILKFEQVNNTHFHSNRSVEHLMLICGAIWVFTAG